MRGVMIVGIKNELGFSVHTQDLEPVAARTIPLCEDALMTFALTVHR